MSNGLLPGVPDLRARVLKGVACVAASSVGAQVMRAVVAVVIARLLTPDEYGLAALATSVADQSKVLSFGNSELRGGVEQLGPKEGLKLLTDGNGWSLQEIKRV